jgi:UMF1 family MFS transporter
MSRVDPSTPARPFQLWAWTLYDFANQPFATVIQTFVFAAYFTRSVATDPQTGTTQWGLAIGGAGLAVALGAPILGAIADQFGRRKVFIAAFSALGILAIAGLWFVQPGPNYVVLGLMLVVLGTIGTEGGSVFYNAMLPALAPHDRIGRWSGWGWCVGYLGGLGCLVVALLVFVMPDPSPIGLDRDQAEHVRATFLLSAVWFAVFALPMFLVTPDVPRTGKPVAAAVRDGMRQLLTTLRHVRQFGHIVRFLIAKLCYIDGLTTVFAFGGVYAAGTFDMTEQQVLTFGIALNITAALGAASFAWIDDILGGRNTILIALVGLMMSCAAILMVDDVRLFWTFGLVLGLFVGPVQAASRSYLARAAPPQYRNEFFGLYALSGKATSFLGPLVVGAVTALTQSQRWGLSTVMISFTLGLILLLTVPAHPPALGIPPNRTDLSRPPPSKRNT